MGGNDRRGAAGSAGDLLPPHRLERLGNLEIIARTIVEGYLAGSHRAAYRGAGRDFDRHRPYQQGDDVRHLDWRLFGRTDRLYVREYHEESNLQALIIVDRSLSMGYADGHGLTKLVYAKYLAAALAHLMISGGDAVGLASYGARPVLHLPPRNRRGHLHDLLLELDRLEPAGSGDAAAAVDYAGGALRRRGRLIVISDLLDEASDAAVRALGRLRVRGDEVIVLRPLTPAEAGTEPLEAGLFFDPERPDRAVPAVPREDPAYAGRVEGYFAALADELRRRGVEYVPVLTSDPVERALADWLRTRVG